MEPDPLKTKIPPDPRLSEGFAPELLPLCDGNFAPSLNDDDPRSRQMAALAFAYYYVNVEFIRLKAADDSERPERLRSAREAMRVRDQLERNISPRGLVAEPEIDGLTVKNLRFIAARDLSSTRGVSSHFNLRVPIGDDLQEFERNLRKALAPIFGVGPGVDPD